MKLLQVATIPETLEAFLLPFAQHFRNRGWTVHAAARNVTGNTRCVSEFDAVHDISWSRQPLNVANIRAANEIRSLVKQEEYDLVHVHTPVASFVTRFALRRSVATRLVYTAHGFHFYVGGNVAKNAIYRSLERLAGRWTDALVVINSEDLLAAKKYEIVPQPKVHAIKGIGIDIENVTASAQQGPGRAQLRRSLGLPDSAVVFIVVAEFIPRKRHSDVIKAFASLNLDPPARLILVGKGPLTNEIRALSTELGVGDRVEFLGYRRDVPSLISASDVLLLVSEQEGLPRSIMEAMALRVPVIGSTIRGVTDLLDKGAGRLVPPGSVEDLRGAMELLGSDSKLRNALATAAFDRVSGYSISDVLLGYEQLFNEVLAEL